MQGGEQHVGDRLDRTAGHLPGGHDLLHAGPHDAEPVHLRQLAVHRRVEHRRRVEQDDALDRGIERGVEERVRAEAQLARRIAAGAGRGEDRLDDVGLDRLVDGAEQVLLAGEVVVHRAAGDPGGVDDLLAAGRGVALMGEQAASRRDQRAPGRGRTLGLGPPVTPFTVDPHRDHDDDAGSLHANSAAQPRTNREDP